MHPTQQLQRQPDGSVLASWTINSTAEIKAWIRSFGPQAEVLEPLELRNEIAAEVAELTVIYGPLVQSLQERKSQ